MKMTVTPLSVPQLTPKAFELLQPSDLDVTPSDHIVEVAGRACYKSWSRPNPLTAHNEGYVDNILEQGHYSVLEHAHVVFYVEHVSRSLLTELNTHRHISRSVESQRYVDVAKHHPEPVIPPALEGTELAEDLVYEYAKSLKTYRLFFDRLVAGGAKRKRAREAARSVLPNSTPVDLVVSGNLRAWRDLLGKRHHKAADAEIQLFAKLVLEHLIEIAPSSFQDIALEPAGEEH